MLEGARGEGTIGWDEVEGADPGFDAEPHWRAVEPEDVLTLIYTSGTTGPPKGVELVHRNIMAAAALADDVVKFPDGTRVISWLPAAHIAERNAHHYLPILFGMTVTTCPNPREIVAYLPAVKPTWFFAVPRIFEKLKAGLEGHLSTQGEQTVGWLQAARRKVELEQAGEPVPDDVAATAAEGEAQLFAGLRAMLGLDEAIAINAGAAPTPRDVLVFFHAIGIPLAELWGMSETCGAGAVNPPDSVRIGTVGPPSLGVEMRLADDGELLVRGDVVMKGYRNQPEKTAEEIDADGWLHTGDIGAFDEDGLPQHRRPQEGDHHQRGRQEHVAGQHRVDPQGRRPADRPRGRDRRRPALQHGPDRARQRLRARARRPEGDRGPHAGGAGRRGGDGRRRAGGGRPRQRRARARRADQEVHDRARRLAPGRRRAHAHDEAQAAGRSPRSTPPRSRRCTADARPGPASRLAQTRWLPSDT